MPDYIQETKAQFQQLLGQEYFLRLMRFCIEQELNPDIVVLVGLKPTEEYSEKNTVLYGCINYPFIIEHFTFYEAKEIERFNRPELSAQRYPEIDFIKNFPQKKECLNIWNEAIAKTKSFGVGSASGFDFYDLYDGGLWPIAKFLKNIEDTFGASALKFMRESVHAILDKKYIEDNLSEKPIHPSISPTTFKI